MSGDGPKKERPGSGRVSDDARQTWRRSTRQGVDAATEEADREARRSGFQGSAREEDARGAERGGQTGGARAVEQEAEEEEQLAERAGPTRMRGTSSTYATTACATVVGRIVRSKSVHTDRCEQEPDHGV